MIHLKEKKNCVSNVLLLILQSFIQQLESLEFLWLPIYQLLPWRHLRVQETSIVIHRRRSWNNSKNSDALWSRLRIAAFDHANNTETSRNQQFWDLHCRHLSTLLQICDMWQVAALRACELKAQRRFCKGRNRPGSWSIEILDARSTAKTYGNPCSEILCLDIA